MPYRIKVTGRTKQFINAFGEELMVENVETALSLVCKDFDVVIKDYTIAPKYIGKDAKGKHEWLVEFSKAPKQLSEFESALDAALQNLNSDYEAKRYADLALDGLQIHVLPSGTFEKWYRSKGKYGSQNKVPRLSNDRKLFTELFKFMMY